MKPEIAIILVLYKTNQNILEKSISSLLQIPNVNVYFIDHSPTNTLENTIPKKQNFYYYFRNANPGFGEGNNFAVSQLKQETILCFCNADLYLEKESIHSLQKILLGDDSIGILSGKIYSTDSSIQKLNKTNPTVLGLLGRRFPFLQALNLVRNSVQNYELRNFDYENSAEVEFLSGSFLMMRKEVFLKAGGFDKRYFLYFEDADLCRTVQKLDLKTVYFPVSIGIHEYGRASHKNLKIFFLFVKSMVSYFRKWGWKWK